MIEVNTAIGRALDVCGPPATWTADTPLRLASELARLYRAEWQITGNTASLRTAIAAMGRIVILDEAAGDATAMYRHNLGSLYLRLAEATGRPEILRDGIGHLRRAVDICRQDDGQRGMYLHNLGAALLTLHRLTDDVEALEEAIHVGRAAVAATPPEHPDRLAHLASLNAALTFGYRVTSKLDFLREAVEVFRGEVMSADVEASVANVSLVHRAQALILLGKETGESSATAEGRLTAQHAAAIETPNPVQRLTARHFYANVCVEAGWLEDASLSYRESVRLLGQLPRWASELQEREGALARFNGLSSDAAATEILRDDVNSALAILDACEVSSWREPRTTVGK